MSKNPTGRLVPRKKGPTEIKTISISLGAVTFTFRTVFEREGQVPNKTAELISTEPPGTYSQEAISVARQMALNRIRNRA